jgi:Ca2+-binding RTX toxin-like protein
VLRSARTNVQKALVENDSTTLNNIFAENSISNLVTALKASATVLTDSEALAYIKLAISAALPKNYTVVDDDVEVPPPPPPPPVNDAPVARDDSFSGDQNKDITGNVLTNDTDANGDSLSIVAGTYNTANGTVTVAANGVFTYKPKAGFYGTDTFDYTVRDTKGATDTGRATFTVKQVVVTPVPTPTPDPEPVVTEKSNFITGDEGDNTVNGTGKNDIVKGRGGNDKLYGGTGDDYLEGNEGNDRLHGGLGKDVMKGGSGNDSFAFTTFAEAGEGDVITDFNVVTDKIDLSQMFKDFVGFVKGTAIVDGFLKMVQNGENLELHVDKDGVFGTSNSALLVTLNNVKATAFGMTNLILPDVGLPKPVVVDTTPTPVTDKPLNLTGTSANDVLVGGAANDVLKGDTGHDKLLGKAGNDTLWGNSGNDTLYGGAGNDWMKGGDGSDRFIVDANLGGVDTVDDLRINSGDKLEIRNLLSFDPLHNAIADFVKFTASGANTIVSVDLNGAAGGSNFIEIARLVDAGSLNAAKMYADGHLMFVNSDVV